MTTADVLNVLIRTNLASGAAILTVAALRKPVRHWLGARLAYGLWLAPALAAAAVLVPARQVAITLQAAPATSLAITYGSAPAAAAASRLDPSLGLIALWLTGAVVAGLAMIHMQRRFAADAARGEAGPAVVGVIWPRIIMPKGFAATFSAEEQALVLAHEQAHIARQDSRANAASVAAQCLFWFNPLVHLAAYLARIDQEMACDETVITRFPAARRAYAQALVKAQLALRPLPLGCYWPSGTEHPLEERIAMLKTKTLRPALRLVGASGLAIACAGMAVAAWAAQPPRSIITTLAPVLAAAAPAPAPTPTPQASRPAPAPAPDATAQVCISNSCMPHPAATTSTSLSDAIAKGDAAAVVAMGGSGKDVVAAMRAGPDGERMGPMLDRMANMDSVTVVNLNGEGKTALVGVDSDGRKMLMARSSLGPSPAGAPIENAPPPPPPGAGTTTISPDGSVKTVFHVPAP